jgi:SOS response regulatory protein OraA/RecX
MALVTSLEAEPRSGGVRVQVDARPLATVGAADVADLHLVEGRELGEAALAELGRRAEAFGARSVALRMLAGRALPSREIVRRLVRKGHPRDSAEAAVAVLVGSGLVNDVEIAQHYVRTRVRQKRVGPARLAADLRRMGIGEREAEAAVAEAMADEGVDARSVLRDAAERKLRTLAGLDRKAVRRRLTAHLRRRGFSGSEVGAVVRDLLSRDALKGALGNGTA